MNRMHTSRTASQPIVIGLAETDWKEKIDRMEKWLETTSLVQASFHKMVNDAAEAVTEPHIRNALEKMAERAERHDREIGELFRLIGRERAALPQAAGPVMGKMLELAGHSLDMLGGASGTWRYLHELTLANDHVLGAVAVTEQLALSLGMKEPVKLTFPLIHEKQTDRLVLMEYMLETAPLSILYDRTV
ncbi:MAG TPA: hypothetical protein VFK44_09890 [Bacillales bacterium]|nr:hypothetical protein [Bacillales bacterium]